MKILFASKQQFEIANLLWAAQTITEVRAIIKSHGLDGEIVYNMILAAEFDEQTAQQTEFPMVMEILESLK